MKSFGSLFVLSFEMFFRTDQHAKDSRIQIKIYTKFQDSESINQSGQIFDKLYSNFNGTLFAFQIKKHNVTL